MANGSDASTRIGRKVTIKSVYLRYSVVPSPTTTGAAAVRILVVYDKQTNAVAPAVLDVLSNSDFTAPNQLSNRDRFVTLIDEITPIISMTGDATVAGVCYKKLNLETMFNSGSAGTVGDITSGSIYLLYVQTGGLATAAVNLNVRARVRYTDV